jgi:hypothetical protein
MKTLLFALIILWCLAIGECTAQTWVPGAKFEYDGVGNRIVRRMDMVCIGCRPAQLDSLKGDNPINAIVVGDEIMLDAYPNPTNTDLTINNRTWKQTDKALVTVSDIQGKTIVSQQFSQATDVVPFARLTPGTYLVNYYLNEKSAKVWRVIKM